MFPVHKKFAYIQDYFIFVDIQKTPRKLHYLFMNLMDSFINVNK